MDQVQAENALPIKSSLVLSFSTCLRKNQPDIARANQWSVFALAKDPLVRFIVIPVLFLIGLVICGAIIDGQLGTKNAFTILLTAAGGIVGLGLYFKKQLAKS